VLQLNLANAYLQGGQPGEAATILNRYTFNNKDDQNGWDLLAQAEAQLGNRDQELAARAEGFALVGRLDQAISAAQQRQLAGQTRQPAAGPLRCAYRSAARPAAALQAVREDVIRRIHVMTDAVKIYHNPRCSKSRDTLSLLKSNGVEPEVVLYLDTPPDAQTLRQLLHMLGMGSARI
jgi:hypothetical protein